MHSNLYAEPTKEEQAALLAERQAEYLADQARENALPVDRKLAADVSIRQPIGVVGVAVGVFLGNLAFGAICAILYTLAR